MSKQHKDRRVESEKYSELSWDTLPLTCHAAPLTSCPSCFCFCECYWPCLAFNLSREWKKKKNTRDEEGGMVGEKGVEVLADGREKRREEKAA